MNVAADDTEGEEFAPEPAAGRRTTRSGRKSSAPAAPAATGRGRGRPKKSIAPAPEPEPEPEPSDAEIENIEPNETIQNVSETPGPATPKKRKSAASRASIASAADLAPPTPQPTASPASSLVTATPLADITASSVNTQIFDETPNTVKPIRAMDTIMDNPIDIVLKTRAVTIPTVEEAAPKSRIVLTHLILNNFKSYAGRQEVGPFHASFSSVVGPNGSGKSNVIDSLLFVFGFRASKMRQGKISALIHNSAQYPNLEYCEVAVHFQEVMDQVRLPSSVYVVLTNSA